jgi:hypothetical protein
MFGTDFAVYIVLAFIGLLIQTEDVVGYIVCDINMFNPLKTHENEQERKKPLHPQHPQRG